MGMFSKKTDLSAGATIPLDQVVAMKNQGYSNNQIIQTLQRDGYSSSQIFDAISQSELTLAPSTSDQFSQLQAQQQGQQMQPMQQQQPMQSMPAQQMSGVSMHSEPSTEELVEAIIDEKWNELVKDINKVIDWKQKADSKLSAMEQQMNDLKDQFDKLHQAIIGKIGDYDKTMLDVGAELQAMEKVFSKVLPTFVDNVSELNRITENIKSKPSNSKKKSK